ncbi:MAG TPA: N-acetylmuramoyl-L-alanine amidase [Firmicutes bacterium]|nr:N-acetylmuramoyl-L-alanine amidase [Bacillota bacterium]
MQIVETNLSFSRAPSKRTRTGSIILHHSASADVSAATIHGWHQGQGWIGIGYHYVIRANGAIERGRPEDSIGSHAGPQGNGDSIGIVLTGNFEIGAPATAQVVALVELIKDLRNRYGNLTVIGHKDVMATACPGRNFPWDELRKRLEGTQVADQWKLDIIAKAKAAELITVDHDPDEPASKWFVLQVILNALKGGK